MRDYSRLDSALDSLAVDLYDDTPQSLHATIIPNSIRKLEQHGVMRSGLTVLDIGAGCGLGEKSLKECGCAVTCIDLKPQAPHVIAADQSFLPFDDESFDLVWARHVLEHSIMPLYTMMEYRRVIKPGGHAYIEVPSPNTESHHESNQNHYSVLGLHAWSALILRLFTVVEGWEYRFPIAQPDNRPEILDKYWAFLLRKDKDK